MKKKSSVVIADVNCEDPKSSHVCRHFRIGSFPTIALFDPVSSINHGHKYVNNTRTYINITHKYVYKRCAMLIYSFVFALRECIRVYIQSGFYLCGHVCVPLSLPRLRTHAHRLSFNHSQTYSNALSDVMPAGTEMKGSLPTLRSFSSSTKRFLLLWKRLSSTRPPSMPQPRRSK